MCSSDVFLGLLAILFPPIAVWIKSGICTADSIINILLCFLGYLPGLIHAWYIISLYPEPSEYDYEIVDPEALPAGAGSHGGRVTYYYVNRDEGEALRAQPVPAVYGAVGGVQSQPSPQAPPQHQGAENDEGSAEGVPPTYEQAVQGDNKVQR